MSDCVAQQTLAHWNLQDARVSLVAHRENSVYKVESVDNTFALRLHRPGYRTKSELISELAWMTELSANGLKLPTPTPANDGRLCIEAEGVIVDVLTWLEAETLTDRTKSASRKELLQIYAEIGGSLAKLHIASDRWTLPNNFDRPQWDVDGLLGKSPVWGRFWENPLLTEDQRSDLLNARIVARQHLRQDASKLDYGLIHADIIPDNVMVDGQGVYFIDFDDGGFGFRLFDLATTLNKIPASEISSECAQAFLDAYQSLRQIDLTYLPLFRALRSFTYLGWTMTRLDHPDARRRVEGFFAAAHPHIRKLMENF